LAHHLAQFVHAKILGDEVVYAFFERGHRIVHRGHSRNHDGDGLGPDDAQRRKQVGALHVRQFKVDNGQIHRMAAYLLQAAAPAPASRISCPSFFKPATTASRVGASSSTTRITLMRNVLYM
jgi:hypothetical protein